jgi:small-conductance mechanosensitive channel
MQKVHRRLAFMSTGLALAICCASASAQPRTAAPPAASEPGALTETVASDQAAVLVYANRPITTLRTRVLTNTPARRVAAAAAQLDQLVDSGVASPVTIRMVEAAAFVNVGGRDVFTILPADVDHLTSETLEGKAAETVSRLSTALGEAVELRNPGRLLRASVKAIAATALFVLLLVGSHRLHRRISIALLTATGRRLDRVLPGEFSGEKSGRLTGVMRGATRTALLLIQGFVTYAWLTFVLRQFPYTRPWGESLRATLLSLFAGLGLDIVEAIPGLFTVAVILFTTRVVVQVLNRMFENVERGKVTMPWVYPETARATRRIVTALCWLFALVVAYPYLPGSSSDAFKGVSVFVGLVVSLGSSGIVNQMMSGLTLTYARALRTGDAVRIGDVEGRVTGMNLLSVKIRTFQGEEITVPNAVVIGQSTTNYSKLAPAGAAYLSTSIGLGYDSPWRQIEAILTLAAERTENVRSDPPPRVVQSELADFCVRYSLIVCLDDPAERTLTRSRLHGNIQDVCNEYGVQIMTPSYESDPADPKVVPPDRWHSAPARAHANDVAVG